jgi:hypothetical protein
MEGSMLGILGMLGILELLELFGVGECGGEDILYYHLILFYLQIKFA